MSVPPDPRRTSEDTFKRVGRGGRRAGAGRPTSADSFRLAFAAQFLIDGWHLAPRERSPARTRAAVTWLLLNLELDLSPGVEDAFRQDRRSGALLPDSLRKDVRKHREAMTAARRDLSPASFSPARRTAATREADRRRDMLTALRRTHDRIDKAVKRAARMLAAGTWPAWLEPTTLLPVWARVDAPPWACTVCGRTGHPPWTQAATVVHAITQAVEVVGYECAAHAGQLPRRGPQTWVDRLYRLDLRLRSRDRVERSK